MGEGEARCDCVAARVATSAAEPACKGRSTTKDEDCEVGTDGGVSAAAICRAMAAKEVASRASLEENKRRASGGG